MSYFEPWRRDQSGELSSQIHYWGPACSMKVQHKADMTSITPTCSWCRIRIQQPGLNFTKKETWTVCGPSKFMEHHGTVHTWGTWSCVCPISIDFWHCKVKRIKTQYSCGLMEQNWPFTHHLFFHFRTNPVAVVHLVFSTQVLETPSELQQLTAKWQRLDTIVASGFASHPRVALPSSFRLFRQSIPSLNLPSKYLKILQAHGHCAKTHLNNMVQDFAGTNGLPNICAVGIIGQTSVTSFAGMVMFHHASTHGWLPKYPNSTVHLSNPFLLNAPPPLSINTSGSFFFN